MREVIPSNVTDAGPLEMRRDPDANTPTWEDYRDDALAALRSTGYKTDGDTVLNTWDARLRNLNEAARHIQEAIHEATVYRVMALQAEKRAREERNFDAWMEGLRNA